MYLIMKRLKLVIISQREEIRQRRRTTKWDFLSLKLSLDVGIHSHGPPFILYETFYVRLKNQSSWFSASSDPLWEPFALCYQTLRVKTHQVSDFPRNFIEFTLWHWEGGWWWRKQGGLTELFRKQRRHQRSIMPHCGGWMWLIVFAGESGRKREGRQDACDVWSQPDCDLKKKKKLIIVVDTARQKMHRWCDVSVWFYVEGWQKPVSRGDRVLQCVWGLANTHTLEHLSPAKTDNTLFNLSVMHHVMSVSVMLLAAGCCCLCVRVTLAVFAQLSTSACPLSGASCCFQEAAFRMANGFPGRTPPSPPSSYWETMGGLPQGHEVVVCV